jgi:hypothetical protein
VEEEEKQDEEERLKELADIMEIEYVPPSLPIVEELPTSTESRNCPAHFINQEESRAFSERLLSHIN